MNKKIVLSFVAILFISTKIGAQEITFQPPPKPGQTGNLPKASVSPNDITTRIKQLSAQNQSQLQNKAIENEAKTPPVGPLVPIAPPEPPRLVPVSPSEPAKPLTAAPAPNVAPAAPPTPSAAPQVATQPRTPPATPAPAQPQLQPSISTAPTNKPAPRNVYTGFQGTGSSGTSGTTTKGSGWDVKY